MTALPPRPAMATPATRGPGGSCALCACWSRAPICRDCLDRFLSNQPRCPTCALPLLPRDDESATPCVNCARQPPRLRQACAALPYDFPWAQLIQAYKFQERLDLLPALLERLQEAVATAPPVDLLLCVPLSDTRLAERGYNQSHELAWRLARRLQLDYLPDALLRVQELARQSALHRAERQLNVRHAFCVNPARMQALRGRQLAVVDDIMTTGATLDAIAELLLRAGAASVQGWVLARA